MTPNSTHDASLRSWVASANDADTDFPIQNLPYGRFRRTGTGEAWRIGVAIGDQVLDLRAALHASDWPHEVAGLLEALASGNLNRLMEAGVRPRRSLRETLSLALRLGSAQERELQPCLVPQQDVELTVPCEIRGYTDFYTGIHHATAVGRQFRPDNPLLPNYRWVPIGYHGRTSSIVASGTPIRRPRGQLKSPDSDAPVFGPTRRLDLELELGYLVGAGNELGEPIPIAQAEDHLFGMTLLNDWSARDIQAWEYQPLGPFLSKNFGTTLSPWVVTMDALAPFRSPFERPHDAPPPLAYLDAPSVWTQGGLDIDLEVLLQTAAMREAGQAPALLTRSNAKKAAYWTPGQLVAHHTSGGCNLQPGDLLGSGTLSGPTREEAGSLLELTVGGKEPVRLPNGETRSFLEDGDTLTLRASCRRAGFRRIGFGECTGTIVRAA
jgi:fumarylacetoacetase